MASGYLVRLEASITTSNATVTTAITWPAPAGETHVVEALVKARNAANGDSATFSLVGTVKRIGTANVVVVGTVLSLVAQKDAGATTWTATLIGSGTNAIVQVSGAGGTTISWATALVVDEGYAQP